MASGKALFFLAAHVPGTSDPTCHMTLCLMELDMTLATAHLTPELEHDMRALADDVLPLEIKLGDSAMFGKDKNIPVRHASIPDAQKAARVDAFTCKYHKPPAAELAFRGSKPTLHVSVQRMAAEEAARLTTVVATTMGLGKVGDKGKMIWTSGTDATS